MDSHRFDALTRELHAARSRRGVLHAALLVAGGLVVVGDASAERRHRHGKPRHRHGKRRRGLRCRACGTIPIARSADLAGCDLIGRNLAGADLRKSDLERACLRDAILVGANLRSADLEGADLGGADLTGANLRNADIRGWTTTGATFCNTIMPDGAIDSRDCPLGGGRCTTAADCTPHPCNTVTCRGGICSYDIVPDGARCQEGTKVCREGQCINDECAVDGDCPHLTCRTATCRDHLCAYTVVANGTGCGGMSQCWDGTCLSAPTCKGAGDLTDDRCTGCCSGGCFATVGQAFHCEKGTSGAPCGRDADCFGPRAGQNGHCERFLCRQQ